MSMKPRLVPPRMPHPALPSANWADCYEIRVPGQGMTALEAAQIAAGDFPPWVQALMALRDRVVALFGLKTSTEHSFGDMTMIGIFPVVSETPQQVVLGFDDLHLDFRLVVDIRYDDTGGQIISTTTLVNRKILLGKIYIAVITPFHKLIVSQMLARAGRRPATVS